MEFYFYIVPPLIVAFYVIAYVRKATVDSAALTRKTIVIESQLAPTDVYKRLTTGVGKFALEDSDESRCIVLLTTKPSFATWGFFYPVHIVGTGAGSQITVGIRSRLFQVGPLVTSAHKQCVAAVELEIGRGQGLPTAQVV